MLDWSINSLYLKKNKNSNFLIKLQTSNNQMSDQDFDSFMNYAEKIYVFNKMNFYNEFFSHIEFVFSPKA